MSGGAPLQRGVKALAQERAPLLKKQPPLTIEGLFYLYFHDLIR